MVSFSRKFKKYQLFLEILTSKKSRVEPTLLSLLVFVKSFLLSFSSINTVLSLHPCMLTHSNTSAGNLGNTLGISSSLQVASTHTWLVSSLVSTLASHAYRGMSSYPAVVNSLMRCGPLGKVGYSIYICYMYGNDYLSHSIQVLMNT